MRSTFHSKKARRRGQALLLAVLIMIFAALLSAAFIGIVAVNLNQTARQTDKNRSIESARAGLDYVNRQLTYSPEGDKWRPTIPQSNEPGYISYYTALDKAQGWTDANGFVKYPDPRSITTGGPQFLAKVERVPFTTAPGNPDFAYVGGLKITVIGLSPDDPTAYHKEIAYKGGYKQAPVAQVMRVVSNYDFKKGQVLVGQANPVTNNGTNTTNPQLDIANSKGDFSKIGVPFTITLSDPANGVAAKSAVVREVVGSFPNFTFTLSAPLATAPSATTRVELAANIGAPTAIDYDNAGGTAGTTLASSNLYFRLSDGPGGNSTEQVDGSRVNGGLIWSGDLLATKLRPLSTSFGIPIAPPGSIQTSGVIAFDNTATAPTVNVSQADGSSPDTLVPSSNSSNGVFATSLTPIKNEMVSDGWNRLKGVPTASNSLRSVADFRPPTIDSGAGLERYRNMARQSQPVGNSTGTITAQPNGALYGYGTGIYIDNSLDKEKVLVGSPGTLQEMSQSDLTQMWLSQWTGAVTDTPDYFRTGIPNITTTTSLEQQHIRGWVGPDEFRARGVEIELGDNQLIITRDARDDGNQSSLDKAWKDPATGNPVTGRYTEKLPWPTTGVVFAEGNVRIKGTATNVPNSLTVVSMGNIYIEGDLQISSFVAPAVNPPKILLLAKKNVVMNPTRLLGRADVQTTVSSATTLASGAGLSIPVVNAFGFKKGDFVQAGPVQAYVKADPTVDSTLTVDVVSAGAVAPGDLVFTPNAIAKAVLTTSTTPNRIIPFNQIGTGVDVIQHRLSMPATLPVGVAESDFRLAFNHEADRVTAANVGLITPAGKTAPTSPIYFANKGIFIAPPAPPYLNSNATVLSQADRKIRGQYSDPSVGEDNFPATAPTTETDAQAATIDSIFAATTGTMNAVNANHVDPAPGGVDWQYNTTSVANYGNLPFFYLAGVGNRVDFGALTVPADRRLDLNKTPMTPGVASTPYAVPLATSISLFLNGGTATVFNEYWNNTLATPNYDQTNQFGFRPTFVDAAAPVPPNEDVLTSDQSFYQTDVTRSTLDSRNSPFNSTTNPNGLQLGENTSLVMMQSKGLVQPVAPDLFPAYRLLNTKLENVTLKASSSTVIKVGSAHTFNVNAYVYAQTGSWFVISGPLFDERLRGNLNQTYLDLNGNGIADAGEYLETNATPDGWTPGDYADLNRNGVVDDEERAAILRYSRFNYSINFTGAIAENQTAIVNDSGTLVKGAVNDWMSKWATTAYDNGIVTHDRIQYTFDPSVVQGDLDADKGFLLPQTPDLYNVS